MKRLLSAKRQKTDLTILWWPLMKASWNQDRALANSACNTQSIVDTLPWKLKNSISKRPLLWCLKKFFVMRLFNRNNLWAKIIIINSIKYFGAIFYLLYWNFIDYSWCNSESWPKILNAKGSLKAFFKTNKYTLLFFFTNFLN